MRPLLVVLGAAAVLVVWGEYAALTLGHPPRVGAPAMWAAVGAQGFDP